VVPGVSGQQGRRRSAADPDDDAADDDAADDEIGSHGYGTGHVGTSNAVPQRVPQHLTGGKNMRIGRIASLVALAAIASFATYQADLKAG
jgi:hypothetical protein